MSVRRNGTLIARYGYDVQGRRIVKRVYSGASGGVVAYLRMNYAGSQVAFETDSVGTTLRTRYTWGPGTDQLVSLRDTTNTHYVAVTDQLGSVRALVKRDGTWAGRLRYDPYGTLVDSAGPQPALRYRWTGREWDAETGFYFHRTRYYDPQAQRFVQEDAIGYRGGVNLYAYVGGRPLTARDPDGLRICTAYWFHQWDLNPETGATSNHRWTFMGEICEDDIGFYSTMFAIGGGGGGAGGSGVEDPATTEKPTTAETLCRDLTAQQRQTLNFLFNLADMNRVEYGQVFDVTGGPDSWKFTVRTDPLPGEKDTWSPGNETYVGRVFLAHAHVEWKPKEDWNKVQKRYRQYSPEFSPGDIDLAHNIYWGSNPHAGQFTLGMGLIRRSDMLIEAHDGSHTRCRFRRSSN